MDKIEMHLSPELESVAHNSDDADDIFAIMTLIGKALSGEHDKRLRKDGKGLDPSNAVSALITYAGVVHGQTVKAGAAQPMSDDETTHLLLHNLRLGEEVAPGQPVSALMALINSLLGKGD